VFLSVVLDTGMLDMLDDTFFFALESVGLLLRVSTGPMSFKYLISSFVALRTVSLL
jgi:hypothetical protein